MCFKSPAITMCTAIYKPTEWHTTQFHSFGQNVYICTLDANQFQHNSFCVVLDISAVYNAYLILYHVLSDTMPAVNLFARYCSCPNKVFRSPLSYLLDRYNKILLSVVKYFLTK